MSSAFDSLIFDLDGTLWDSTVASKSGLYPGVESGLKQLAVRYPLFIVSSCVTSYIDHFFRLSGLKHLFKDTACHGGTGMTKAENIALIVRRHRLERSAYIGDTAGDQNAALTAGAVYFHVNYGFGTPDRECHAFNSFKELVDYFLE